MIAYFDSGTSNSRVFLLHAGRVLAKSARAVGCRDAALQGDPAVLVRALYGIYTQALAECGATDAQVETLLLSGMGTSASGLREVEHLPTPAGVRELRAGMVSHREDLCFHREILLVPGLKTLARGVKVPPQEAALVNNVRGEETEVLGILRQTGLRDVLVLLPGSHTQAVLVEDGRMTDLLSTVTGELYGALLQGSIVGAGVGDGPLETEFVSMGARAVQTHGFNRALYITRSLALFSQTTPAQRRSYLEGVVNAGTAQAAHALLRRHPNVRTVAVYGGEEQFAVLSAALAACGEETAPLFVPRDPACPMAVYGAMALMDEA